MWVAYGNATASVALAVEPGATTRALLPLNAGRIKLVARAKDGKLLTRPLRWDIYLAKVNFEGKRRHITYNTSRQPILNLNAGRYLIVLASGKSRSQRDLVVTAGDIKPFEVKLK